MQQSTHKNFVQQVYLLLNERLLTGLTYNHMKNNSFCKITEVPYFNTLTIAGISLLSGKVGDEAIPKAALAPAIIALSLRASKNI